MSAVSNNHFKDGVDVGSYLRGQKYKAMNNKKFLPFVETINLKLETSLNRFKEGLKVVHV